MDESAQNVNRENNQFLLNAIKSKFAAENSNSATTLIPPKLSIPALKEQRTASFTQSTTSEAYDKLHSSNTDSDLNQFLLENFNESTLLNRSGFVFSTLQTKNQKFDTPTTKGKENLSALSRGFDGIKITDYRYSPTTIDLTAALTTKSSHSEKLSAFGKDEPIKFNIPFIECDRKANAVKLTGPTELSQKNPYLKMHPCLMTPSKFARITCLQIICKRKLPHIDHCFKAKHEIHHFRFDTKSPDDLILAKLQNYQR